MPKELQVMGMCVPEKHYMVDMGGRIERLPGTAGFSGKTDA